MSPNYGIISIAKKQAEKSQHRFRVGAVIFDGKRYYGSGFNQANKTHPKSPHPYKSIHAEFAAVLSAIWNVRDIRGFSIYVHRLKKDGTPGLSKPCRYCQFMLSQVGVDKIFYSDGKED